MASTISAGTTSGTAIAISGDTSGSLQLQTNGTTTAVTIDTSQNVGIGTTSPTTKLHVATGANTGLLISSTNGTTFQGIAFNSNNDQFTIGTLTAHPTVFYTNNAEQMRIDTAGLLKFNSGYGSVATAYGCRAWVNFNGTGTVAIRASGNVSSITDNGTGIFTVNYTTALTSSAAPIIALTDDASTNRGGNVQNTNDLSNLTTSCRLNTFISTSGVAVDATGVYFSVFR